MSLVGDFARSGRAVGLTSFVSVVRVVPGLGRRRLGDQIGTAAGGPWACLKSWFQGFPRAISTLSLPLADVGHGSNLDPFV